MAIRSHRDLLVYQKSLKLALACYKATRDFPKAETYGLSSQLQRAAVSVSANISEGHGRSSTLVYLNHLDIASGSLAEVDTHLTIAKELCYLQKDTYERLIQDCEEVGRVLSGLRKSLEQTMIKKPSD